MGQAAPRRSTAKKQNTLEGFFALMEKDKEGNEDNGGIIQSSQEEEQNKQTNVKQTGNASPNDDDKFVFKAEKRETRPAENSSVLQSAIPSKRVKTGNENPEITTPAAAAGANDCSDLVYGMLEHGDTPEKITGMIKEGKQLYAIVSWKARQGPLPNEITSEEGQLSLELKNAVYGAGFQPQQSCIPFNTILSGPSLKDMALDYYLSIIRPAPVAV